MASFIDQTISALNEEYTQKIMNINPNTTGLPALCYPLDIMSANNYANSYTAFYILVHKEEKLVDENALEADNVRYVNAASGGISRAQQQYGRTYSVTSTLTQAVGMAGSAALGSSVLSSAGIASSSKGVKDLATATVGLTATVSAIGENNTAFRQQKAFIVLPTPALTSAYSMSWDQEPMPLAAGVAEALAKTWDGDPQKPGALGWLSNFANVIGDSSAAALTKVPEFGGYGQRVAGIAMNPRKEQLFKDVNFREFNFTYTFAPRNQQEAQTVEEIIYQFKFHAHPSLRESGANMLYNYPSEFDIVHYYNNQPNPNLPKHATSILKNVSVNYAPNGHYNVNSDGFPSQIQLSLQFEEVALLTKKDIAQGY